MNRLHWARLLIALVVFFNLQCAVVFIADPEPYASGFELSGIPGQAAVRGMGILFLMWNVPYVFALLHPLRNRLALIEALCMQAIGAAGESLLLLHLDAGHTVLASSILRFIWFDTAGLAALLVAFLITRRISRQASG